jgi:hypothetical protein
MGSAGGVLAGSAAAGSGVASDGSPLNELSLEEGEETGTANTSSATAESLLSLPGGFEGFFTASLVIWLSNGISRPAPH